MPQPAPLSGKQQWLALVGAMALSIAMYGVVVFFVAGPRTEPVDPGTFATVRLVLYALGLLAVGAGLFLCPRPPSGPSDALVDPARFRARSFLAVCVIESGAVLGLVLAFLTRRTFDFVVLGGAALAAILLHVIPTGLRYWDAQGGGRTRPTTPG